MTDFVVASPPLSFETRPRGERQPWRILGFIASVAGLLGLLTVLNLMAARQLRHQGDQTLMMMAALGAGGALILPTPLAACPRSASTPIDRQALANLLARG